MLMPASSEFLNLCHAQVDLLTQGLGAVFSVVYLAEELTETANTNLVPIVAHPESAIIWAEDWMRSLLSSRRQRVNNAWLLASESVQPGTLAPVLPAGDEPTDEVDLPPAIAEALFHQRQLVVPLLHEGGMMGLLVTARADRIWNEREQAQIEQIAETLAIGCVLDQRSQWFTQNLQQQQLYRERQHEVFDDLLHQFRNPLTALRTFGKLLLKRLSPEDANRNVASGIVRESDRLHDLLKQLNEAVDLGDDDLRSLVNTADPVINLKAAQPRPQLAAQSVSGKTPPLLPGTGVLMGAQPQLEPHLVIEVLEPLLVTAEAIAQERQLDLQVNLPDELPPVLMDEKALQEVLNNLIDNALKYTPAGGCIYVEVGDCRVLEQATQQAIVIADTGPGIPAQDLPRLFERHYRGVQAATDIPGTGLGLAIARELVNQMQGEIQVFSPALSSDLIQRHYSSQNFRERPGTAFVVWLPEVEGTF